MQRRICTRKIDELGRIALPLEARAILNIKDKQSLDICINEESIILKPNSDSPSCILCGESAEELNEIGWSLICDNCIAKIKDI